MRGRILMGLAAIAIAGAAGYLYFTPHLAFKAIQEAIESGNRELLSEYVDFPQLREGLRDQLTTPMLRDGAEDPLGAAAAVIASKFIEAALEVYVTPAGLAALASGRDNDAPQEDPLRNARLAYESPSRFVASVTRPDSDEAVEFVLSRNGVRWRLTNIIAPTGGLGRSHPETAFPPAPRSRHDYETYLTVRDGLRDICEEKLGELAEPSPASWDASGSKSSITSTRWLIGYTQPFAVSENGKLEEWSITCRAILLDGTWTFDLVVYRSSDGEVLRVLDGFEGADKETHERVVAMRTAEQEVVRLSTLAEELTGRR